MIVGHARLPCGLVGAPCTDHQDHAALLQDHVFEAGRHTVQLVEPRHLRAHVAHHHAERTALVEDIDAEAAETAGFRCQIDFQMLLQMFLLIVGQDAVRRSEEHTSELQSLMRISYAVFCLKNKQSTNHPCQPSTNHK